MKEKKIYSPAARTQLKIEIFAFLFTISLSIGGSIWAISSTFSSNNTAHDKIITRLEAVERETKYLTERNQIKHQLLIELRLNSIAICNKLGIFYQKIIPDNELVNSIR